jgi:hypothetical protein
MIHEFILTDYLQDLSVCDKLINYHDQSPNKATGAIGLGVYDPSVKDSIDALLPKNELYNDYLKNLKAVVDKYIKNFEFCNYYSPWAIVETPVIQRYNPKQGFHKWHTERSMTHPESSKRHLVFMTYLNNVTDRGETEWYYQKLKIKPKKGLTVLWPTDWTYTHRGIASPSQVKYIITGWYSYTEIKNDI